MAVIPQRRTPETEYKLLTLYALKGVGPCTDMNLLEYVTALDLMNYIDMMVSLTDMCKQGYTTRCEVLAAWKYELTPAGAELLSMFENRIPASKREKMDAAAPEWRQKFLDDNETMAHVTQSPRGEYQVTLSLRDPETELMQITLSLPTNEFAQRMAAGWKKNAAGVYQTIISLLKEEK